MKLEYSILFAKLKVFGPCKHYTIKATSGKLSCMNKPSCINIKNKGPIPIGTYWIDPKKLKNLHPISTIRYNLGLSSNNLLEPRDWGDWLVPLIPDKLTNTYNRDSFYLHGGIKEGSAGCIDIGGGILGNKDTNQLYKDIKSQLFKIKLIVKR